MLRCCLLLQGVNLGSTYFSFGKGWFTAHWVGAPGLCALYDSGAEGGDRLLGLTDVGLYRIAVPAQAVDDVVIRGPGRCQGQACGDVETM
jgi:hypothetical protein